MSDVPHRLAILMALTEHLKGITPGNGYDHDLSQSVYRGRNILGADVRERPILSILEAPRPDIAIYTGEWEAWRAESWTLLIQGISRDDKYNPSDSAYYLCADVEKHLGRLVSVRSQTGSPAFPDEHLLGGLITGLQVAPPVVRPPEDRVSASAFFFLPLRIGVAVDTSRPYTSA